MALNEEIPKSRITLTYRTDLDGERVEKALPFKMLVMGDLSHEKTRDAKTTAVERGLDLDGRLIRMLNGTNLDTVMADMGMSIEFTVPDRITGGELAINLPINSIRSFTPERIVQSVEPLQALVLLKKLLTELQGSMDNRKNLRNAIRDFNNWRRHARDLPVEIAALEAERDAETDALAKNKLEQKIEQLKQRQETSRTRLEAFFTDLDAKLAEWKGFELPGVDDDEEE